MNDFLYINHANDYALDVGAEIFHPMVSVVHFDELGEIRHSLNKMGVYAIFVQDNFPVGSSYGMGGYDTTKGSLTAAAPGQVIGKADDGHREVYHGWALLFDAEFMRGTAFEERLTDYYERGLQHQHGLPNVKYCASELCLSPSYFGDVVRSVTGDSPTQVIQHFLIDRAKSMMVSGLTVTQVADTLGFEYPQHFTRFFKKHTGMQPSKYVARNIIPQMI